MSDKKVAATNIYTVVDNELARMHELLKIYMQFPQDSGSFSSARRNVGQSQMGTIYKRILDLQNVVLKAAGSADAEIQKAVAELALTGSDDDI